MMTAYHHHKRYEIVYQCLLVLGVFAFFSLTVHSVPELTADNLHSHELHLASSGDSPVLISDAFDPFFGDLNLHVGRAGPWDEADRLIETALRPAGETPALTNPGAGGRPVITDTPLIPGSLPQAPIHAGTPLDVKLTSRYTDGKMLGFLRSTTVNQVISLYSEISRLVDTRHVAPPSYEQRTSQALLSIAAALENAAFLQVAGVTGNPQSLSQVQAQLREAARSQPARSAQEAIGVMQWASELAYRTAGISRTAVAVEFLNGTLDALDQFSSFVPDETYHRPSANLKEHIVGIGVELRTHARGAILAGVIDGGPAAEVGLLEGDLITSVDGRDMAGRTLNEVADAISGRSGSSVSLVIERDGRRYRADLVRRQVYVSSVSGTRMIDPQAGVGYVRLRQFSESSKEDLEQAMWKLFHEGMQTLVLDLRGNPGGLLDEAIDLCNLFLPCGTIVSTRGRTQADNSSQSATQPRTWRIPLIVLIDGGSASASEIFAAAIQENDRGIIVGRRSYGKGTVQTHFPLRSAAANLKLTTAHFYSPAGRLMAGEGVIPDYVISGQERRPASLQEDLDIQAALQLAATDLPRRMSEEAAVCRTRTGRPELYGTAP